MKKFKNTNKGITLIALVITVIVLVILAGVSIASISGEKGIINEAKNARKLAEKANAKEQLETAAISALTKGTGIITKYKLDRELKDIVKEGNYTIDGEEEGPWIVTVNGFTFQVTEEGDIEEVNGIVLSQKKIKMLVGREPVTLIATLGEGITGTIEWKSSNTSVALVSNGTITAIGDGTATITAKITFKGETYEAKCEVTVTTKIENVTLITVGDIELEEGQTSQLTVTKTPSNSNEELTYTSNNTTVATVDSTGKVTAKGVGTATITVAGSISTNVKGTCTVTVKEKTINVTAISVADITLEQWQSSQLTVTKTPSNSNEELTYTSSKPEIATVDTTGKVTAVAEGTATITVAGKISTDVKGTCTVTVTKAAGAPIGDYVTYNVSYTDVYTGYEFNKDGKNDGWRILDGGTPNGDGTYSNVKLISTGIPAKVNYHYSTNAGNSANGWWGTDAQVEELYGSEYATGYSNYEGRYAATGLLKNFESIPFTAGTSATANKGCFTKINSTTTGSITGSIFKATGASEVHNLTLEELNTARGLDATSTTSTTTDGDTGLFYLRNLAKENSAFGYTSSISPYYWLASPHGSDADYLRYVRFSGAVGSSNNETDGVRVVVSLSSKIQKNEDGKWEIVQQNDLT